MTQRGTALVTGAGSGIGRAAAMALSADGWSLVLAGRRAEPLEDTRSQLSGPGLAVPTDVSDPDAVDRLFDAAVAHFGRVDFVFNNAGVSAPAQPIDELPVAEWTRVVAANLTGTFLCMRAAFRVMKQQSPRGGRIVNNGSISAYAPRPHSAPYAATKHGVSGLTRSGALDGRAHDIAVGQIDIGNVSSSMTDYMSAGALQPNGTSIPEPVMAMDNVARTLTHMAALPLDANILFVNVMATNMPFVGRG